MRLKIGENIVEFSDLIKEYEFDIFNENISNALLVLNDLPIGERNIIMIYSELGSIEEVSKICNCSKTTMYKKIKEIKSKIKDKVVYDY